jgi:hypothetical protein
MTIDELKIFIPIIIQGIYDLLGWFAVLKEQTGNKYELIYRVIKETLDFPVTGLLLIFVFHWSIDSIASFYLLKWFGACDAVYIILWKIFNPGKNYTQEGIWWMWFTPLAWHRSKFLYDPLIEASDKHLYIHLYDKHYFKKGIISLKEFQVQLAIGLPVAWCVYHFKITSFIFHLIIKLIGIF